MSEGKQAHTDRRRGKTEKFDVASLTARAVADSGGADPAPLEGYLQLLASVAARPRRLRRHELDARRAAGIGAAEAGLPLGRVVDLYLSATWLAWRHLPRSAGATAEDVASSVFRATNDAIVAVTEGYESAHRMAIQYEEATRREFVDDLLHGTAAISDMHEKAARFGLQLGSTHIVAVARAACSFVEPDRQARRIGSRLLEHFGARDMLTTTKDGQLVCVAPGNHPDAPEEFARHCQELANTGTCQVGVGRPYIGPAGVARSYQEARDVLDVAARLDLGAAVLHADELLVFQVLLRDRAAITDLVETVLAPLRQSRGGAKPLLDTLGAYFGHGNAVAAAQNLGIGTRTVTYRLQRVRELTGYAPTDPRQRFTLEAAILGARLLGWPSAAPESANTTR